MSIKIQESFVGGMNLLSCDTDLEDNQYRIGFNLRNRYDNIEPILSSIYDPAAPQGIIQDGLTFGNYIILFVGGSAWYRLYNATGWRRILGFRMSTTAARYWHVVIPVATTNYVRLSNPTTDGGDVADANGGIRLNNVTSAFSGNLPGLLVQDNISQPQFIFIGNNGLPTARTTQTYAQWEFELDDDTNLVVDKREYVPIGNCMAWVDGILYVVSQDFNYILRSVSGRPLDFVVNVDLDGDKGGDARTTSYSVGTGGISCIRPMSDGSLFVAASNANFAVSKNMTQNSPTLWGEYTFIRKFLFNATCMSDRAIIDSLGDTRFIALTGIRSFNAILQTQNEGRNVLFTSMIQSAFSEILQNSAATAAILWDNYELYALDTIFGPAIAVYDTVNQCWSSFDAQQTGGKRVKFFMIIETAVQRLFAVTEDNKFYTLYQSTSSFDTITLRTGSYTSGSASVNQRLVAIRPVIDEITSNFTITATPVVDNRFKDDTEYEKNVAYEPAVSPLLDQLPDVNTMLYNAYWSINNVQQGYKTACILSWGGSGKLTQYALEFEELQQDNPMPSR
jgi:hypothetical protein